MSTSDWANLDELNERAEDDMTTAPEADLRYLRKWLNERPNSPIDCAALARVLHWAALASKQAPSEPFWHAVVSNKSPVINKAIKREDVAQEYADQCHEQGYRDAEVVPLYLASRPAEAQAKREPADLQRIELSDGAWLERGGPLSIWGLYRANTGHLRELNRFEREFIDCTIRAAIAVAQGGGTKA